MRNAIHSLQFESVATLSPPTGAAGDATAGASRSIRHLSCSVCHILWSDHAVLLALSPGDEKSGKRGKGKGKEASKKGVSNQTRTRPHGVGFVQRKATRPRPAGASRAARRGPPPRPICPAGELLHLGSAGCARWLGVLRLSDLPNHLCTGLALRAGATTRTRCSTRWAKCCTPNVRQFPLIHSLPSVLLMLLFMSSFLSRVVSAARTCACVQAIRSPSSSSTTLVCHTHASFLHVPSCL